MKQFIFTIKFVVALVVFSSCQPNDIVKEPQSAGSGQTNKFSPNNNSTISSDILPPDGGVSGGGGSSGGQTVIPASNTSLILSGKTNALFTNNGQLTTNVIAIGYAEFGPYYPIYDIFMAANVNVTWLWLGASYEEGNVIYTARGFPIAYAPGYGFGFVKDAKVQVVLSGAGVGDLNQWKASHQATSGSGPTLGYWQCGSCTSGVGTVEGKMTVTSFELNSSGKLNLTYTLKIGNKTMTVTKSNFVRIN